MVREDRATRSEQREGDGAEHAARRYRNAA
jgi:hypothetical protein